MKNLEAREGFKNRHVDGLPAVKTIMKVVTYDMGSEHIYLCEWYPFDRSQHSESNMPAEGYLGTAWIMKGQYAGVGFEAWQQHDGEFVYYGII